MSDRGTSRSELMSAAEAAALVLAQAFGLGDEARITTEWPVDDGDTVLVAEISGESTGSLVLAVNDEVAERLENNSHVLAEGFTKALEAFRDFVVDGEDERAGALTADLGDEDGVAVVDGPLGGDAGLVTEPEGLGKDQRSRFGCAHQFGSRRPSIAHVHSCVSSTRDGHPV